MYTFIIIAIICCHAFPSQIESLNETKFPDISFLKIIELCHFCVFYGRQWTSFIFPTMPFKPYKSYFLKACDCLYTLSTVISCWYRNCYEFQMKRNLSYYFVSGNEFKWKAVSAMEWFQRECHSILCTTPGWQWPHWCHPGLWRWSTNWSAQGHTCSFKSPFHGHIEEKQASTMWIPHPLIYMRGLKSDNVLAIMDFLYFGEANVFQENLDTFLSLAEELKLKGLSGDD